LAPDLILLDLDARHERLEARSPRRRTGAEVVVSPPGTEENPLDAIRRGRLPS
jgi:hypothetical protein